MEPTTGARQMTDDRHEARAPDRPGAPVVATDPDHASGARRAGRTRRIGVGLLVGGALAAAGTAVIHLHLWLDGYRSIPKIGPLFMANVVIGFALALTAILWRRWPVAVAGALFLAATAGGLLFSASHGLFGFRESLGAPWAGASLVVEIAGACAFGVGAWFLRQTRAAAPARIRRARPASSESTGA
jgi:hypothetical protein